MCAQVGFFPFFSVVKSVCTHYVGLKCNAIKNIHKATAVLCGISMKILFTTNNSVNLVRQTEGKKWASTFSRELTTPSTSHEAFAYMDIQCEKNEYLWWKKKKKKIGDWILFLHCTPTNATKQTVMIVHCFNMETLKFYLSIVIRHYSIQLSACTCMSLCTKQCTKSTDSRDYQHTICIEYGDSMSCHTFFFLINSDVYTDTLWLLFKSMCTLFLCV